MFSPELTNELYPAIMELRCDPNARKIEVVVNGDLGLESVYHAKAVNDPACPIDKLILRYRDSADIPHTTKIFDITGEIEAFECGKKARRIGPQTPREMLVDFERRRAQSEELAAISKAAFERGEITEDDLYEEDFMLARNIYPLTYEAPLRGVKIGCRLPLSVDMLEAMQSASEIDRHLAERARFMIQTEALKYLRSL